MKELYFSLFLLLLTTPLSAQVEFAPAGAEWYYRYQTGYSDIAGDGYAHIWYSGDTLLEGRNCKILCNQIVLQSGEQPTFCAWKRYVTQSGDSIFAYTSNNSASSSLPGFEFLFRNNFQLNESLDYTYQVSAVDTLIFNGNPVRRFSLGSATLGAPVFIYDRFGPEYGLSGLLTPFVADNSTYSLRCYQDAAFPRVEFSADACDLVLKPADPAYKIYVAPNPVGSSLRLWITGAAAGVASLQVLDASGRLALAENRNFFFKTELDVSGLPAGFYVLAFQIGDTKIHQKFIKN